MLLTACKTIYNLQVSYLHIKSSRRRYNFKQVVPHHYVTVVKNNHPVACKSVLTVSPSAVYSIPNMCH